MFKSAFDLLLLVCFPMFMLFVMLALIFINWNDTLTIDLAKLWRKLLSTNRPIIGFVKFTNRKQTRRCQKARDPCNMNLFYHLITTTVPASELN